MPISITTVEERKRDWRSDYEVTGGGERLVQNGLMEGYSMGHGTARVRIEVGQTINLGRLDPERKFESVRFSCAVELPVPNTPEQVLEGLAISKALAEEEVNAYVAALEEGLG